MNSRLAKLAVIAVLACSMGLHWGFFQSLAWVGMVLNYSQTAPLTEALSKTFDGNHPCSLCKEIAKSKQSEKKSEPIPVAKKFDYVYLGAAFIFGPSSPGWEVAWPDSTLCSLTRVPPVPPPRQLPG